MNILIGWDSNLSKYVEDIQNFPQNLHSSHGGKWGVLEGEKLKYLSFSFVFQMIGSALLLKIMFSFLFLIYYYFI